MRQHSRRCRESSITPPSIPNLFIVGSAKAGTTSLSRYLGQHPDVFMPPCHREPAFFAEHTGHDLIEDYLKEFTLAKSEPIIGEKSGAYLFDAHAAKKIQEFNPNSKIIIVLRNPVDMAYSLYLHNRREGFEVIPSFEEALEREVSRAIDPEFIHTSFGYYANFLYRQRATYAPQIKRYYNVFPAKQILLLKFHDLKNNCLATCQTIFRFLGIADDFVPDLSAENIGGCMRLPLLNSLYVRNQTTRNIIMSTVPQKLRKFIYRLNRKVALPPKLPMKTERYLTNLFASDVAEIKAVYNISIV
jgi:hypothetical protein